MRIEEYGVIRSRERHDFRGGVIMWIELQNARLVHVGKGMRARSEHHWQGIGYKQCGVVAHPRCLGHVFQLLAVNHGFVPFIGDVNKHHVLCGVGSDLRHEIHPVSVQPEIFYSFPEFVVYEEVVAVKFGLIVRVRQSHGVWRREGNCRHFLQNPVRGIERLFGPDGFHEHAFSYRTVESCEIPDEVGGGVLGPDADY